MNNLNANYHLVYGHDGHFYLFELELTGNLVYKVFDTNMELISKYTITNKNVLNFNLTLDDSNRINLIYLLKSGELFLCINNGLSWTESQIGVFDTKSNIYHQFEILFVNNKINIIYSFSNYINSEIITMHHIVLDKKVEEQNNVIKYILRKGYNEYSVVFDEIGTIHLIYNTTTNFESYIYHSFYSPYRGLWSSNPKELSTRGKENSMPYILVDSKSNINTAWLEMDNNRYRLKYAKMPVNGKDKYIWQYINIPVSFSNQFTPMIYEEDGILKILCYDHNVITTIVSNDYGNTWINKGDKQIQNISKFIRASISKDIHPQLKIKDVLIKNTKINDLSDLYFSFNMDHNDKSLNIVKTLNTSPNIPEKKIEEEETETEESPKVDEVQQSDTDKLLIDKEELKSLIIELIAEDKDLLNEILKNQQSLHNDVSDLKKVLAEAKPSLITKLFKVN